MVFRPISATFVTKAVPGHWLRLPGFHWQQYRSGNATPCRTKRNTMAFMVVRTTNYFLRFPPASANVSPIVSMDYQFAELAVSQNQREFGSWTAIGSTDYCQAALTILRDEQ
jgi:hypothetical protein